MPRSTTWTPLSNNPKIPLLLLFACWKTLLILIAFLSPAPGYDTSTSLLGAAEKPLLDFHIDKYHPSTSIERLLSKLCRWDAIYFTEIARRGYVHEQEWAFGWGFTRLLSFVAKSTITIIKIMRCWLTPLRSPISIVSAPCRDIGRRPRVSRFTPPICSRSLPTRANHSTGAASDQSRFPSRKSAYHFPGRYLPLSTVWRKFIFPPQLPGHVILLQK